MIGPISHYPQQLRQALLRASLVVLDTETTGLDVFSDRVLSYGLRLEVEGRWVNFLLFTQRCSHLSILRHAHSDEVILDALAGLQRQDLVLVGHNLKYDLAMLHHEGVPVRARVHDTLSILRLLEQDRVHSQETRGRQMLAAPNDRRWTNNTLKDLGAHLLGIQPAYTPSRAMDSIDHETHAVYLAHDLLVTHRLYDHLWPQLPPALQAYYEEFQSPLSYLLLEMRRLGIAADAGYAQREDGRLSAHASAICAAHQQLTGRSLAGLTDDDVRQLVYRAYGFATPPGLKKPSIAGDQLRALQADAVNTTICRSLELIIAYREVESLRRKLRDCAKHIARDGHIHSKFDNKQATGRISSSEPNLQQVAGAKVILQGDPLEIEIRNRNLLTARPGCLLVAADVAQADVRVLAHGIDSCNEATDQHARRLRQARRQRLPHVQPLLQQAENFRDRRYQGQSPEPLPEFDPNRSSALVQAFTSPRGDFYSLVASQVTGRTITKSDPDRKTWKTILLAQLNGQTPSGLAIALGCTRRQAEAMVRQFFTAFPDIEAWVALQQLAVALTGRTHTWEGRWRQCTPHRWMVDEPRVRVLLRYKSGHRYWLYWLDVTPLRPTLRYVTCYVNRIWCTRDEQGHKPARLVYDSARGRVGDKLYPHLEQVQFYKLPYRNIPWRSIRAVQRLDKQHRPIEQGAYEGFDATCRSLINAIMQGGTTDMLTRMMIRMRPVCEQYGAKLLLNVHDELVFEAPGETIQDFIGHLRTVCSFPPSASWKVPIVMEVQLGRRFGRLHAAP